MFVSVQDPNFRNFSRLLLKLPEHTWGVDANAYPGTFDVWTNEDVRAAITHDDKFAIAEESWVKQRAYIPWSISVRI